LSTTREYGGLAVLIDTDETSRLSGDQWIEKSECGIAPVHHLSAYSNPEMSLKMENDSNAE
jgi:hypothetical protein